MAAVQDDEHVRPGFGHFSDELRQFLIGQVETARHATVPADQRLVEPVRLEAPELGRGVLLGAVSAVIEQRNVPGARSAKVGTEPVDHLLPGRLLVDQGLRLETEALASDPLT